MECGGKMSFKIELRPPVVLYLKTGSAQHLTCSATTRRQIASPGRACPVYAETFEQLQRRMIKVLALLDPLLVYIYIILRYKPSRDSVNIRNVILLAKDDTNIILFMY